MRVQFTATFEELVDIHIRSARKGQSAWLEVANASVSVAAVIALIAYIVQGNADGRLIRSAVAGLAVAIPYGIYCLWSYKSRVRTALRKYYVSDDPFEVVFELKPEGVSVSQMKTTSIYEWSTVGIIEELAGDVVLHTLPKSVMIVRARAFDSPEGHRRFVALARQYRDSSRV